MRKIPRRKTSPHSACGLPKKRPPTPGRGCIRSAYAALCAAFVFTGDVRGAITSVVQTNGTNTDGTDLAPTWTGNPAEPLNAGVYNTAGLALTTASFADGSQAMVDRVHQHRGATFNSVSGLLLAQEGAPGGSAFTTVPLPSYLTGKPYVRIADDMRENSGFGLNVTVDADSTLYLLVDTRISGTPGAPKVNTTDPDLTNTLSWVTSGGWKRVNTGISPGGQGDFTAIDEAADATTDSFFAVYAKTAAANSSVALGHAAFGTGISMYQVVAGPAPEVVIEQPATVSLTDGAAGIGFGSVNTGTSSGTKVFTIRNTRGGVLTISGVSFTGGNAADFRADTTGMASSLAPDGTTTFKVAFNPSATGPRAATLQVFTSDPDEATFDIAVAGTGTAGVATLTDPPLVFEGFDLTPGALYGRRGETSTGWATDWLIGGYNASVQAGSLIPPPETASFYTLPVRGNRGFGPRASPSLGERNIGASFSGTTLYGSFMVDYEGGEFANVSIPLSGQHLTLLAYGTWQVAFNSGSFDTSNSVSDGVDLVIFRLDYNVSGTNDRIRVWIDKDPHSAAPDVDRTLDVGNPGFGYANGNMNFAGRFENGGATLDFDEFRLGTTLESVIGYRHLAAAVGAPATAQAGVAQTISLTAQSLVPAAQAAGYTWTVDFGDGTTGTIPALTASPSQFTHTWTQPGTYTITAEATDFNGFVSPPATALITVPEVPASPNLLVNGSFETGDLTGWVLDPEVILREVVKSGAHFIEGHSNTVAHDGTKFCYINVGGDTDYQGSEDFLTQSVTLTAGRTYLVSGYFSNSTGPFGGTGLPDAGISMGGVLVPGTRRTFTGADPLGIWYHVSGTYTPVVSGPVTFAVRTFSRGWFGNDFSIDDFSVTEQIPPEPEIAVEQPADTDLANGTAGISFGTVAAGGSSAPKTFRIKNTGEGTLTLTGVNVTGDDAGDFAVNTSGMSGSLTPGSTTEFTVTFNPAAGGPRTALLRILSNDADEKPFGITVRGNIPFEAQTVFFTDFNTSPLRAEITPGEAGATGVQGYTGLGPAGNQFGGNFLRSRTGNAVTLHLTNLPPHNAVNLSFLFAAIDSLDGTGSFPEGDFFRVTLDGVTVFNESFANAQITQTQSYQAPAGAELARRVDLGFGGGIYHSDSAYDFGADPRFTHIPHTASSLTFRFIVEGPGIQDLSDESWAMDNLKVEVLTLPPSSSEIAVAQPAGTDLTSGAAGIGFGTVVIGGSSGMKTFSVTNNGSEALAVSGVSTTGGNAGEFLISTAGMLTSVPPGGSTAFRVFFRPGADGARSTTLRITSSDADESSFEIALSGAGTPIATMLTNPPLVYEGFDLAPGVLYGRHGETSTGWAGDWHLSGNNASVAAGSLTPPLEALEFYTIPVRGNRGFAPVAVPSRGVRRIGAAFSGPTLFGSFLADYEGNEFANVSIPLVDQELTFVASETWQVVYNSSSFDTFNSVRNGVDLVIFRLDYNVDGTSDRIRVWIDRNPYSAAPDVDETLDVGNPGFTYFNGDMNFAGRFENGGATLDFDEFRLGTTLESVIGYQRLTGAIAVQAAGNTVTAVPVTLTAQSLAEADQAAGHTWTVDFGDGTTGSISPLAASPVQMLHTWALPGIYTVSATVTDRNGFSSVAATATIIVAAGGPEIAVEQPAGQSLGGSLTAWGYNEHGETSAPAGLISASSVSGGQYHTLALRNDGTVAAWGYNVFGQTDVPAGLSSVTAVSAGARHSLALKNDGTVVAWGSNVLGQSDVPAGLTDVTAIAAGGAHSIALKSDGTVIAWGSNSHSQSIVPPGLTGVTGIATRGDHNLALKSDGTVVAWGGNNEGQAAVPAGLTGVTAVSTGYAHSLAVKSDGTVVAWGWNDFDQTVVPPGLTGVVAVAGGNAHSVALKSDGTVVAWGYNASGQTVVPAGLGGVTALAAGDYHTLALRGRTAVDFGSLFTGTSGAPKSFTIRNTGPDPLLVSSVSVTGGAAADFTVGTAGMSAGVPGPDGTTSFTVVFKPGAEGPRRTTLRILSNDSDEGVFDITLTGEGLPAPDIAIEQPEAHPLGGVLTAWGYNEHGEATAPAGLANVTAVSGGQYHTLALRSDGTVAAFGFNAFGQTDVPAGLSGVTGVSAGARHSLALKSDGTVVAWGSNVLGQTDIPAGLTGVTEVAAGGAHSIALKSDGTVVAWGSNSHSQSVVPPGLSGIIAIATHGDHNLALKNDGTVTAWGGNNEGQSTVPAGLTGVTAIAAGYAHSAAVKNDGTLVAWGWNASGQTSVPAGLSGVVAVAAGNSHTAALKGDGTVVAWGYNESGQTVVPPALTGVTAIAAGDYHTLALRAHAVDFGGVDLGAGGLTRSFTIRNSGFAALSITGVSVSGGNAGDFAVNAAGVPAGLPAGGTTAFTVVFTPGASGIRSTVLHIVSNDPDEGDFSIALTGTGFTPLQSWRAVNFGSADNSGAGADGADPDNDGISNILEHALAGDPNRSSQSALPASAVEDAPGGRRMTIRFDRSTANSDITMYVEASDSLAGTWTELARSVHGAAFTGPAAVSEVPSAPGSGINHVIVHDTLPAGSAGRRFTRVRVTTP